GEDEVRVGVLGADDRRGEGVVEPERAPEHDDAEQQGRARDVHDADARHCGTLHGAGQGGSGTLFETRGPPERALPACTLSRASMLVRQTFSPKRPRGAAWPRCESTCATRSTPTAMPWSPTRAPPRSWASSSGSSPRAASRPRAWAWAPPS